MVDIANRWPIYHSSSLAKFSSPSLPLCFSDSAFPFLHHTVQTEACLMLGTNTDVIILFIRRFFATNPAIRVCVRSATNDGSRRASE